MMWGQKPVKEGETHDVKILKIASMGDGVTKVGGFVIFVPNTKEGDNVKIKVEEVRKNFAIGKKIEEKESLKEKPKQEKEPSKKATEETNYLESLYESTFMEESLF